MKQTIAALSRQLSGTEEGAETTDNIDLSIQPSEQAVIYLIPLTNYRKDGGCYCFAALSIPDVSYYDKPLGS